MGFCSKRVLLKGSKRDTFIYLFLAINLASGGTQTLMIVIIYTYTKLIKINPLRSRLRQMSPVVNWPRETSLLVTGKRRDEK